LSFFQFKKKKIQGYVYVADSENELFKNVKAGDIVIKKDKSSPYIVVDHRLESIIISNWPGKLYKVEILDPSKEKDINKGLVKNIWYTRTFGVNILEEVSVKVLFGKHGKSVVNLANFIKTITEENVINLAKFDNKDNKHLYSKAWKNWIELHDKTHPFLEEEHINTLKLRLKDSSVSSPINQGLSVIANQLDKRAEELVGDSAYTTNEDGDLCLQPTWAKAQDILLHAGMSFATDPILTATERASLRNPLQHLFDES
jgi:hypothetical protein